MLARLRSGFSLDSEYHRVQDRFRLEDGIFVFQEFDEVGSSSSASSRQQQQQQQQNLVDRVAQEASQREYAELIRWSNTNIDPQLLERDQQQQQQHGEDR